MNRRWLWVAVPAGIVAGFWGSLALGSYVYLLGMGYPDGFVFPWDQLWVALPWVLGGGWHGIATLVVWEWIAIGVASACFPLMAALAIACRQIRSRVRRPDLWGSTGFANRGEMDRGGINTKRSLFDV